MASRTRNALTRFWLDNALSIVLLLMFAASMVGQIATGRQVFNEERSDHGLPTLS